MAQIFKANLQTRHINQIYFNFFLSSFSGTPKQIGNFYNKYLNFILRLYLFYKYINWNKVYFAQGAYI